MLPGYRSNRNVVFKCTYHVVWCPKYRRSVLTPPFDSVLKVLIKRLAKAMNVEVVEMEVMPDHVHLLLDVDPQFGIHRVVKRLKGATSHELRRRYPQLRSRLPTLWTNAYFCATTGGAPRSVIKQYIENQKNV